MSKLVEFISTKTYRISVLCQNNYNKYYKKKIRRKLINKDFSLFSPNCYAGIIYNRLGLQFKSPTINLFFPDKKQYLKFLQNLKYYLSITPTQIEDSNYSCPVALIDDVKIVFNHSNSFEEALNDWEKRKKRVNYNNLFFIFDDIVDAEYEDLVEFNKLACKGKVILTAKKYNNLENTILIKKYAKDGEMKPYLLDKNWFTGKNPADKVFDYVSWLNS